MPLCIVLKVLFLKKPLAIDFNFFESSSENVWRWWNHQQNFWTFFQPMSWFSDGVKRLNLIFPLSSTLNTSKTSIRSRFSLHSNCLIKKILPYHECLTSKIMCFGKHASPICWDPTDQVHKCLLNIFALILLLIAF